MSILDNPVGILIVGIIVGAIIDYILFRLWHASAHTEKFKQEEREQKEKEEVVFIPSKGDQEEYYRKTKEFWGEE